MTHYEKYKGQYISKYEILSLLWEQQKYGSAQDSRGRAKAMLTIMDMPPVNIREIAREEEDNNELYGE